MKKLLLFLIPFLFTITAYSQNGYSSVFLRVTDSATFVNSANTTAKHAANYADIWYSTVSGLFWEWDAGSSTYVILGSKALNNGGGVNTFLPNIQTGNYVAVIGDTIRVVLMRSASAQNFTIPPDVFPIGSYIQVVQDSTGTTTIVAGAGVAFENPSGTLTLTENTFNVLYQKYSNGWIISKGSTGTSGATAAGATGNVQYKSAGGGLQAETAFTYDSATNVLDVDNVTVDDEVYGAGWNASVEVPTKNALYDKIETLSAVDYTRNAVAISAGTLTLDANSQTLRNFDLTTTVSSAFTIAFSNATNFVQGKLTLRVTGSVAITMPSAVVMDLYEESVGRWNSGTNILTLTGVTASAFMMEFYSDGTNIWCSATNRGL